MAINISLNYSPNFNPYKRKKNQIKFVIFHYTGMKKESAAINRLTKIQSQVSSHYLIKNNGEVINLVPDLYIAWHAGISAWKNFNSLNKYSIGIEISNPGHEFNYKKFSKKQINSLLKLTKHLIKKYKINPKNILGHSDISPDRKKDPGEKFPWEYLAKKNIGLWHKIEKKMLKNFRENKIDHFSQKAFLSNIYKIGYSRKSVKKIDQKKYQAFLIKSFQRRYRQELVDGKIDKECLLISNNLIKKKY
jgi:N-acetylmuramoyl-L-alanine amidase